MNWTNIWISVFGTSTWLGVDLGFWVSMGISLIVALLMNVVFWSLKPKSQSINKKERKQSNELMD